MPRSKPQVTKLMKIAVPLFKERVAPYFGASSKILLVEMRGDLITQKAAWDVKGEGAMDLAGRLVYLGVKKVICGGIQNRCKDWLISQGVVVLENQRGTVRDLLINLQKVDS